MHTHLQNSAPLSTPARIPGRRRIPRILRHANPARRAARDAIAILIAFAALEIALQFFAPRYRQHRFDAEYTGGAPIAVNSLGLRSPEVSPQKQRGERRVLVLGDSTTYGTGVSVAATWPQQLAALL